MNDINYLSILLGENYRYSNRERTRCYVCEFSIGSHDISKITDNIFISNYTAARCKYNLIK